jgi:tetratricopeptide (TPR) repeat protein
VSYFGEGIMLDGSDPDLFFNLGYAFWLDRDMPGAVHWLREAVRRNPADDEAHYVLGVALQASGSAAEAAREKELARQLSSTHAEWEAKQPGVNTAPRGLERLKLTSTPDACASMRPSSPPNMDQRAVAAFHRPRRACSRPSAMKKPSPNCAALYSSRPTSQAHFLWRIICAPAVLQDAIDALTIADERSGERQAREFLNLLR